MRPVDHPVGRSLGPVSAALVSVGGSPAPVLYVLRRYRPAHVWYFCSTGSRQNANEIHFQLDWHPYPRFIEVDRFEELGPCYRVLRTKLPEILAEAQVNPAEVLVDYTGGTKTMSAALVLASLELFSQFSYVGGDQREKGGLGITIDSREKVLYQGNPWNELAIREIQRAEDLWLSGQFDAVGRVFREVAPRMPHSLRFEAFAVLADGLAARQRLDFSSARGLLKTALGRLRPMFEADQDRGPLPFIEQTLDRCESCASGKSSNDFLRELLDNSLQTAALGRFEDAAARLYRAMEMQGQLWLEEATQGRIIHGKCSSSVFGDLPEPLRALPFIRPNDGDEIKLSLEQCFRALAALSHKRAVTITVDLERANTVKQTSRWRAATDKRNSSILAHGVQPIGSAGFEQMKLLANEFLGFELNQPSLPTMALNPKWLAPDLR